MARSAPGGQVAEAGEPAQAGAFIDGMSRRTRQRKDLSFGRNSIVQPAGHMTLDGEQPKQLGLIGRNLKRRLEVPGGLMMGADRGGPATGGGSEFGDGTAIAGLLRVMGETGNRLVAQAPQRGQHLSVEVSPPGVRQLRFHRSARDLVPEGDSVAASFDHARVDRGIAAGRVFEDRRQDAGLGAARKHRYGIDRPARRRRQPLEPRQHGFAHAVRGVLQRALLEPLGDEEGVARGREIDRAGIAAGLMSERCDGSFREKRHLDARNQGGRDVGQSATQAPLAGGALGARGKDEEQPRRLDPSADIADEIDRCATTQPGETRGDNMGNAADPRGQ